MRQPVPFGKYLLLDRISVGGMAEVFKAKSYGVEGFEKIIAIKRILPTMGEDRDFIKMFIDEAKIAGQLAHANICQIFELGRIDGSHFIAMEYIWGKDLLQIQNRVRKLKQQMPVPMACFAIAKVLEGLDYAHRKRDPLGRPLEIVHRDCSPQNVLVSYEGEVKVIDFGIAKATSRNSRTMAGVLKGKFGYMSPEQVRGLPLDRRSDIFALGTMLYECLTGERLFQGETDFSTLEKVRNVDVASPRSVNPAIPESVERVIMKALAKDVDDRYQWCSEMLADLQAYLMGQDVVFTAKSLASWLKDVFNQEIEKERQQLEQYKRVGRDGLIAGVPAAAAKLDVVEHLGEAGEADVSDATQLGGPSFEDIDRELEAVRAAGSTPQPRGDEDRSDFGEEAPTEIFGDDLPAKLPPVAAGPRPTTPNAPLSRPPKPPPAGRSPTQNQPAMAASSAGGMTASASGGVAAQQPRPLQPMNPASPPPPGSMPVGISPPGFSAPAPYGAQPNYNGSLPPMGTPNHVPATSGLANNAENATILGVQGQYAPVNPAANNYGPAYRVTGPQQVVQPPGGYGPQGQSYPHQHPMQSQTGPIPHYGSGPIPQMQPGMYPPPGAPQPMYGQDSYPVGPMGAVDSGPMHAPQMQPPKKSSMGRDVAIGIAIAAVVLGAFFVVKFAVLDKGTEEQGPPPSIATIQMALPAGASAQLFVDDKLMKTVASGEKVDVDAGKRRVKLIGAGSSQCEATLDLPGGKITPLQCELKVPAGATTGSAATPATGSGSAAAATPETKPIDNKPSDAATTTPAVATSGSGSGSAVKPDDKKPDEKKPDDKMPPEVKPTDPKTTTTSPTTVKGTSEIKPPEPKTVTTTTTKPPEPKTTTTTAKPPEPKTTAAKPPEPKTTTPTTTPKPVDTKKPPEPKTAATKTAPSDQGFLDVFSKPSAQVLIDGVDSGLKTPVSGGKLKLTPGKHKVSFVIGGDKFTYSVNIKAGATEVLSKDLPVQ